jgi:hypothetical protein
VFPLELLDANAQAFAGPLIINILFNRNGGLLTYISFTRNADVSALGFSATTVCGILAHECKKEPRRARALGRLTKT